MTNLGLLRLINRGVAEKGNVKSSEIIYSRFIQSGLVKSTICQLFSSIASVKIFVHVQWVLCLSGISWQSVVSLLLNRSWKYLTETFLNCFDQRDRCCSVFLYYYTTRRTEIRDGCKVDHQVVHYQNISCFVFFSLSWTNILVLLVGWILYHLLNNALFVEQTSNWISKENYFTTSIVKCWLKTWTFNSELDFRCQDVTIAVELQFAGSKCLQGVLHLLWSHRFLCTKSVNFAKFAEMWWKLLVETREVHAFVLPPSVFKSNSSINFIKSRILFCTMFLLVATFS